MPFHGHMLEGANFPVAETSFVFVSLPRSLEFSFICVLISSCSSSTHQGELLLLFDYKKMEHFPLKQMTPKNMIRSIVNYFNSQSIGFIFASALIFRCRVSSDRSVRNGAQ